MTEQAMVKVNFIIETKPNTKEGDVDFLLRNDFITVLQLLNVLNNTIVTQVVEYNPIFDIIDKVEKAQAESKNKIENNKYTGVVELTLKEAGILWKYIKLLSETPPKDREGNPIIVFGRFHMKTVSALSDAIGSR